jgi:hypothetical protein
MAWIWADVRVERDFICPTLLMADWMEDADALPTRDVARGP